MQRPLVRTILVVLALLGAAGAGYKLFLSERNGAAARAAWNAFDARAVRAAANVAEMRAAEQAYVAQGQGEQFWMARVATLSDTLKAELETLRVDATSADAARGLSDAATALAGFLRLDGSARSYVASEQPLMASDLIFGEGLEALKTIATGVDEARTREREAREREAAQARRSQLYVLAAGVGLLVGILLLLASTPGPKTDGAGAEGAGREVGRRASARTSSAVGVELAARAGAGFGAVGVEPASARASVTPATSATSGTEAARVEPGQEARADADGALTSNIADAARLCADLARVAEAQELPGLLQRAALLLDASGIIVWLQDTDRTELRPAVSHGYPPAVMSRMQAIPRDADNATAAAFRSGELRLVAGDGSANGALVVPLVTSAGPVGAMAAEIRHGSESNKAVQALATLVAAQLATLIPPAPASS